MCNMRHNMGDITSINSELRKKIVELILYIEASRGKIVSDEAAKKLLAVKGLFLT